MELGNWRRWRLRRFGIRTNKFIIRNMNVNIETIRTKDKLLISIPIKDMKAEEIDDFLSLFKTEFAVRNSEMTAAQAEEISEEIKSAWWKKNKSRIEKMISENE